MVAEICSCKVKTHEHHAGVECTNPGVAPAQEIDNSPTDTQVGMLCLECYQELASELHDEDASSMLDLEIQPAFPACEVG